MAASVFIVSSGPFKYSGVTLPDADVVAELAGRGTVFRTDVADAACRTSPAKTGPDNDGRAGGCHHVRVTLNGAPTVQAALNRLRLLNAKVSLQPLGYVVKQDSHI